jgi:hypothetical protein
LRGLWRGRPERRFRSWAVQLQPSAVDVQLWLQRDVEILDVPLDEYVAALERQLWEFDVASVPA